MAFVLPDQVHEDVRRRYAESHRRYHDLRHVDAVLGNVDRIARHSPELPPSAVEAARLAALWHDAVYVVGAADNEERSAELAAAQMTGAGAKDDLASEVARLVRLTAHHDPAAAGAGPAEGAASREEVVALDPAGALLCDADLAILGAPPTEYARYRADVRAEWSHLDDAAFDAGRGLVVAGLLKRPWLFVTSFALQAWEAQARHNLSTDAPPPSR